MLIGGETSKQTNKHKQTNKMDKKGLLKTFGVIWCLQFQTI